MKELSLHIQAPKTTVIPNYFIDTIMPKANGEFIKVFLCLLRYASDPSASVSVSFLADKLNNTETDILRAIRYWEKEHVLTLTYDSSKTLTDISFNYNFSECTDAADNNSGTSVITPSFSTVSDSDKKRAVPDKTSNSKRDIDALISSEEFSDILYIVQRYTGKTLSSSDTDTLIYIYRDLKFSLELMEYLIEYCVSLGHKSLKYIEKVAVSWAEHDIKTADDAKKYCQFFNKDCYLVLKAFGLSKRDPVDSEIAMIEKWSKTYGFTEDIITEACNRTMSTIHQPSFEYADSILSKWRKAGVKRLEDIARLDSDRHNKAKSEQKVVSNKFNNMVSRSYVYEDMEKRLLN